MKHILLTIIISSLLSSCCSDSDLNFTSQYLTLLDKYSVNDTVYFKSSAGDLDTFFVAKIDSIQECGIIMAAKRKNISIEIQHLPTNHWAGGTEGNQNGQSTILNQELITIEKLFDKKPEDRYFVGLSFRDFRGELKNISETKMNSTADLLVDEYWEINNEIPAERLDSTSVTKILWTEEYGLTAYYKQNGEFYKLRQK